MDGNYFMSENQINDKEISEMKNDQTMNKLKLRKNALNNFLAKKTMMKQDAEIENKAFQDLSTQNYIQQHEEIKKILMSNNDQNLIKVLNYINEIISNKSFNDRLKSDLTRSGIGDLIINLYYSNMNNMVFSLCCSILESLCTTYFEFSSKLINEEGIKIIYDKLSRNFSNNIKVVSNCVVIYKESLSHLMEILQSYPGKFNNLSYNSKKYLCHFTNWILCEKKIFSSFNHEAFLAFFNLMKLLKTSTSVPNKYELDFEQGNGSINNLFSFVLEQPVKDLEYFALAAFLELLILLSKDKKYTVYLVGMEKNVFDVIKRLCGYLYLNNNSTQEERENFPMLEPFMLGYCFEIMTNLALEVIKRDDIMELICTLFNNYRYTVRFNDIVPINIMDLFICFSENMLSDERIYNFLTSPEKKILFNCIKFYVKNKVCYVKVMQLLINIFDVKNLDEIENVKNEKMIKCIADGLEDEKQDVNRKSVYCFFKIIEINSKKKYNIDLLKYFEVNQVLDRLKSLVLNKGYQSISEEENAEDLIAYIENMIKTEENK